MRNIFIPVYVNNSFKSQYCKKLIGVLINYIMSEFKVKLLSDNAKLPYRATSGSAGYDLFSAEDIVVPAKGKALVKTDIAMTIPDGYYGRIAPRSSLALKCIDVGGGVIDSDYTGNISVILYNHSNENYQVNKHDRIAQLILTKIITPDIILVDEINETDRIGGFGSTGK